MYNKKASWRDEFLFEHLFKYKTIPRSEGVINQEWTYVRFIDRQPGYEWLYHRSIDPLEKHNLADDNKYWTIKNNLKACLQQMKRLYK